MAPYPKAKEKVRVGDMSDAATRLRQEAIVCQAHAGRAADAFTDERERLASRTAKRFAQLAKLVLRDAGDGMASAELDGPSWARFDALAGYHLGLAAEASSQKIQRDEAKASLAALAAEAPEREAALARAESARQQAARAASSAKGESLLADKAFEPHRVVYDYFYAKRGLSTYEEVENIFARVPWYSRALNTQFAQDAARWQRCKPAVEAMPTLAKSREEARALAKSRERELAQKEADLAEQTKWQARRVEAERAASRPAVWLDKGAPVAVASVYGKIVSDSSKLEPILAAVTGRLPALRAETREELRYGLTVVALDMSVKALRAEQAGLGTLIDNLKTLSGNMDKAKRSQGSSAKASVKMDMGEISGKLSARSEALQPLAKSGPAAAVARIAAMDWSVGSDSGARAELSPERAAKMEKAAAARFGKDSPPAMALARARQGAGGGRSSVASSQSSDDSGLSAWFWCSMLSSDTEDSSMGASVHADAVVSAGGAAVEASAASFDFGSVGISVDSSASFDLGASTDSFSSSSCSSSSVSSCSSSSSSSCSSSSSSSCSSSSCSS